MIKQTLEWHRFGDIGPAEEKDCLLIPRKAWDEIVIAHTTWKTEGLVWCSNAMADFDVDDTDLWAYWNEPKEET